MVLDSQSRRFRRWLLLGLGLLVLLLILCTCNGSNRIQTDLRERGAFALSEGGYDPSYLSVDGRDATLSGVVTSAGAQMEMLGLLRGVRGIRLVNDDLRVEAVTPTEPAELIFSAFNGAVSLSGTVPEEARADLLEAASDLYGENVVDNLTVDPAATSPWLPGVLGNLAQLNDATSDVELRVQDGALRLEGNALSEEAKADLGAALSEATNLTVQNELEVSDPVAGAEASIEDSVADASEAEGVETEAVDAAAAEAETAETETDIEAASEAAASTFSLQLGSDGARLTGSVDAATKDTLLNTTGDLVGAERVTDELQVEDTGVAPAWLDNLGALLPRLNSEVTDATLEVTGDDIGLRGQVASEAQRTDLEEALRSTVGPEVTVRNELTVAEAVAETSDEQAPAETAESSETPEVAEAEVEEEASAETPLTPETNTEGASTEGSSEADGADGEAAAVTNTDVSATDVTGAEAASAETPSAENAADTATETDASTVQTPAEATTDRNEETSAENGDADTETSSVVESIPPARTEAAALRAPEIRVALLGDTVELSGSVASEEERAIANSAFAGKTVDNRLSVDPQVSPADWLSELFELSTKVDGNVTRGVLDVSEGRLTLRGTVASDAMRTAVGSYVSDAMNPILNNGIDNLLDVQPLIPFSEDGK